MTDVRSNKPDTRPFYTIKQIAKRWQCSEKTVRRMIERGDLVAHRLGSQLRISADDLVACERINRCGG